MENVFFIKDYINHPNIRQTDQPSVTGSEAVQGSTTKNYLGYGVGLRYTVAEALAVKVSYEHSVRLPIARELLGNGTNIYANVALKPENSDNFNAGLFGTADMKYFLDLNLSEQLDLDLASGYRTYLLLRSKRILPQG